MYKIQLTTFVEAHRHDLHLTIHGGPKLASPFNHCCHMGTVIKHPVPDWPVKPYVICNF